MATRMLGVGPEYGQRDAGVGFWLYGDRIAGSMFDDPTVRGGRRLAAWGLLHKGRLLPLSSSAYSRPGEIVIDYARPEDAPLHAIIDAVTDRALKGPTELTPDELATLVRRPPDPAILLDAQRMLQKVGITWPGSPEIPPEESQPTDANPSLPKP